jgi:hypothetical protein
MHNIPSRHAKGGEMKLGRDLSKAHTRLFHVLINHSSLYSPKTLWAPEVIGILAPTKDTIFSKHP